MHSAKGWIQLLELEPHPEGGFFKEVIRENKDTKASRAAYTSIYFLLTDQHISHFHRIDADEIWYYHAGQTLTVHMIYPDGQYETVHIGANIADGDVLQHVVPAGTIFASSIKDEDGYALVGCMCQPGFMFEHFEMLDQPTLTAQFPGLSEVIKKYAVKTV